MPGGLVGCRVCESEDILGEGEIGIFGVLGVGTHGQSLGRRLQQVGSLYQEMNRRTDKDGLKISLSVAVVANKWRFNDCSIDAASALSLYLPGGPSNLNFTIYLPGTHCIPFLTILSR